VRDFDPANDRLGSNPELTIRALMSAPATSGHSQHGRVLAPIIKRGAVKFGGTPRSRATGAGVACSARLGTLTAARRTQLILRSLASHPATALVSLTGLPSKGMPAASNKRATCTADHLPPRAAGMPRSSRPAAKQLPESRVSSGVIGLTSRVGIPLTSCNVTAACP